MCLEAKYACVFMHTEGKELVTSERHIHWVMFLKSRLIAHWLFTGQKIKLPENNWNLLMTGDSFKYVSGR